MMTFSACEIDRSTCELYKCEWVERGEKKEIKIAKKNWCPRNTFWIFMRCEADIRKPDRVTEREEKKKNRMSEKFGISSMTSLDDDFPIQFINFI